MEKREVMEARMASEAGHLPGLAEANGRRYIFSVLDRVRLSRDFASDAGLIPGGTEGTVLQVFGDGAAYQIEFEGPYEIPETVPVAALKLKHAAP